MFEEILTSSRTHCLDQLWLGWGFKVVKGLGNLLHPPFLIKSGDTTTSTLFPASICTEIQDRTISSTKDLKMDARLRELALHCCR